MTNFLSTSQETVTLYIDESSLKMARVKVVSGKPLVLAVYYKNILGMTDSAIPQEIRLGMSALGAKARRISIILASKYVITKNIEVPSLDEKEIEDIVRLQAVRHTPYSKEEVIVGHINLDVILERYTKSLLAIASTENVRKKTDLVELAGYDVESVYLAPEVMAKTMSEFFLTPDEPLSVGFVYLDAQFTDLLIVQKKKPFFIRSIPVGVRHLKQDEAAGTAQLMEELKKTCEVYQSEDSGALPKRFMVVGIEGAQQAALAKGLETALNVSAEALTSGIRLPLSEEAKRTMAGSKEVAFLEVISGGLLAARPAIDLIPEDLKIKKSFRTRGQEIFMGGAFLMVIFILTIGVFLTKIYFRNIYLDEIHRNFEMKKKEAEELITVSEDTRVVRDFSKKKGRAINVLNDLQTILPQEMYLSEITLSPDSKVSIKGTSELMSTVFSFVTEFENHSFFKGVSPDYTKSRKENDKDVSDFGISAMLEVEDVPDGNPILVEAVVAPAKKEGKEKDEKPKKEEDGKK